MWRSGSPHTDDVKPRKSIKMFTVEQSAATDTYLTAMAELRIRLALVLEALDQQVPKLSSLNWSHAGTAQHLLGQAKAMCEFARVNEDDVTEGYGE